MLPRAISLCPSIFIPPSFSRYISGTSMHQCFFAFNHTRSIMSEQSRPGRQSLYDDSAPTSLKAVKVLTATTIGAGLSLLSGLTLTGTVIGLIVVTPLLVLFSPVLVPAAIASFLAFAGFVFSGGCGAAGIVVLTWIYQYVTGKHPPGADKLDQAKEKFATKAREMKEKAREYGQQVQQKAQVTTQGS